MIFGKYPTTDLVPAGLTAVLVLVAWVLWPGDRRARVPTPAAAAIAVFAAAFLPAIVRMWADLPLQPLAVALAVALALALAWALSAFSGRAGREANARSDDVAKAPSVLVPFLPALALFPFAYTAMAAATFASGSRYHEDLSFYMNLHHRILHVGDYWSTVWGANYFSHHLNPVQFLLAIPSRLGVGPLYFARALVLTIGLVYLCRLARPGPARGPDADATPRTPPDAHVAPVLARLAGIAGIAGQWSWSGAAVWTWVPCFGFALFFQTVTNQAYDELLFYGTVPAAFYYHRAERPRGFLAFAAASALLKETVVLLLLGFFLDNLVRRRSRKMLWTSLSAVLGYLLVYALFFAVSGIDMRILEFNRFSLTGDALWSLMGEKALVAAIALAATPTGAGAWIVALPAFFYLLTPIPGFSHPMSHHCTIVWSALLSNYAAFWKPSSRLDALRTLLALPLGITLLAVSGAPAPFPSEDRRSELEAIRRLVPPDASVATTALLSPSFGDRSILLVLERRSLWQRPPHDAATEIYLLYEVKAPPVKILTRLGTLVIPIDVPGQGVYRPTLALARIPSDGFWAVLGPRFRP